MKRAKQLYYANANKNEVVQVFSYAPDVKQNQLTVIDGRLPQSDDELVLDEKAKIKDTASVTPTRLNQMT